LIVETEINESPVIVTRPEAAVAVIELPSADPLMALAIAVASVEAEAPRV
jgi:hypothetical protein